MNSSNSFNICPRCGNANALNAKYCSRCGGPLKIPEEPVVCPKCHTRNTPMANFCRNCGVELKVGAETKICPKCGKEVAASDNVCACGYSFATLQQTLPKSKATKTKATANETQTTDTKTSKSKVYKTKGGRGWAIAALVLLLLFAYYVIAPYVVINESGETTATMRPEFLVNFDGGIANFEPTENHDTDLSLTLYGYDFVEMFVDCIKSVADGNSYADVMERYGVANLMIVDLVLATMIAMFVHLIICVVRICTGKRSKRANWTYFVFAILSTVCVGMIVGMTVVASLYGSDVPIIADVLSWFTLPEGYSIGYVIWIVPIYFWFFFFYSLCAKAKKLQENM